MIYNHKTLNSYFLLYMYSNSKYQAIDLMNFDEKSEFVGYTEMTATAKVIGLFVDGCKVDEISDEGEVIFDKTPFYATMGGQMCDTGVISGKNFSADSYNQSASIVLGYKEFENFDTTNAGQWGMALAYRHIGQNVGPAPTYTLDAGTKGWELSYLANVMPHTYLWLKAVKGKTLIGDKSYNELFGRIEWQF